MKWNEIVRASVLLATVAASFGVQAASHGVTVSVTPEKNMLAATDDVLVKVTFVNTSSEPQQILKWNTPFAGQITQPLFDVTRDGQPVTYLGAIYKRVAPKAADYYLLKPGESYSANVELSALYDMSVTGDYKVRYRTGSVHLFQGPAQGEQGLANKGGGQSDELASDQATLWIDGVHPRGANLADQGPVEKFAAAALAATSYVSCSTSRQSSIASARTSAGTYSTNASNYLNAGTTGTRYTKWFGTYNSSRYTTVRTHFTNIKNAFANQNITVDCTCTDPGTYAYVYPTQPYKIYVCGAFWSAPATGTDSKAGTLVHEMSHFNVVAATDDWAYGQSAAASLAVSNPTKAIDNADSHEYFGENTPALP
jgi:peptidyl-Lys metalloendopeptidase